MVIGTSPSALMSGVTLLLMACQFFQFIDCHGEILQLALRGLSIVHDDPEVQVFVRHKHGLEELVRNKDVALADAPTATNRSGRKSMKRHLRGMSNGFSLIS